jgi:hypothetical protein
MPNETPTRQRAAQVRCEVAAAIFGDFDRLPVMDDCFGHDADRLITFSEITDGARVVTMTRRAD